MKVALCLSGQARSLHKTIDNIKEKFLDQYDVDVFASTWLYNEPPKNRRGEEVQVASPEEIIDLLKPRAFHLEVYREGLFNYWKPRTYALKNSFEATRINMQAMAYQIHRANELSREAFQAYDVVIRSRFDLLIESELTIFRDINSHDKYTIFLPAERGFGGYNDRFAYGSPIVMNWYAQWFNYMRAYGEGTPESSLKLHLNNILHSGIHGIEKVDIHTEYPLIK
jgi:hypothetical protein